MLDSAFCSLPSEQSSQESPLTDWVSPQAPVSLTADLFAMPAAKSALRCHHAAVDAVDVEQVFDRFPELVCIALLEGKRIITEARGVLIDLVEVSRRIVGIVVAKALPHLP